jgi:hypothetical protein
VQDCVRSWYSSISISLNLSWRADACAEATTQFYRKHGLSRAHFYITKSGFRYVTPKEGGFLCRCECLCVSLLDVLFHFSRFYSYIGALYPNKILGFTANIS